MIDSHHHFWAYDPVEYPWIGDGMEVLKRDFLPPELEAATAGTPIDGVVSVQARQEVKETQWLLDLAAGNEIIRGVVGWVPLRDENAGEVLDRFAGNPWLKAVRHVIQDEPDPDFILGEDFNKGIVELLSRKLVYDILVFHFHLPQTIRFVDEHPDQVFVLDHIAKPEIQADEFAEQWRTNIRALAKRENVFCKFSGVVTEVRDESWDTDLIKPYFDTVLDAFGPQRLMYGSDWPVCLLKSDYRRWFDCVQSLVSGLSESEQQAIMHETAVKAYDL